MRPGVVLTLVFCAAAALPAPLVSAGGRLPTRVTGDVVSSHSRWVDSGRVIVTESVLRTEDGDITVLQRGGSADGIAMVVLHTPPVLRAGDRVVADLLSTSADPIGARATVDRIVDLARPTDETDSQERLPYVRTPTVETNVPIDWASNCAFLTYHSAGTTHVAGTDEFAVMDRALARWAQDSASCSYMTLSRDGTDERTIGYDGVNMVIFHEDRWCPPPINGIEQKCYNERAAGITTLFFIDDDSSDRNGEIVDADIELNAVDFTISVDDQTEGPGGRCRSDLANTFTHEAGHFLGLDHTCYSGDPEEPRLRDHTGDLIPYCDPPSSLSTEIKEATMYNYQECRETKKASLEADDIAGVCAIYPLEQDPGVCERPSLGRSGCCTLASRGPGAATSPRAIAGSLLLVLGSLLLLRRRPRRR